LNAETIATDVAFDITAAEFPLSASWVQFSRAIEFTWKRTSLRNSDVQGLFKMQMWLARSLISHRSASLVQQYPVLGGMWQGMHLACSVGGTALKIW